jgi:hypothetical protein
VQELCACICVKCHRAVLDEAETEMDMAKETAFVGLPERRAGRQLDRPADVVEDCRGEEQVRAQSGMQLSDLAADGCNADRVL